ncbi:unnamed protein product [Gadus morhua 'NCC']
MMLGYDLFWEPAKLKAGVCNEMALVVSDGRPPCERLGQVTPCSAAPIGHFWQCNGADPLTCMITLLVLLYFT